MCRCDSIRLCICREEPLFQVIPVVTGTEEALNRSEESGESQRGKSIRRRAAGFRRLKIGAKGRGIGVREGGSIVGRQMRRGDGIVADLFLSKEGCGGEWWRVILVLGVRVVSTQASKQMGV